MGLIRVTVRLLIASVAMMLVSSVAMAEEEASNVPVQLPDQDVVEPQTTQPAVSPGERIWNLQDADILSVINEVSQETGKNFIVDPRVTGKISLISSRPLPKDEVYQVFLSVLGVLGYSAVQDGDVVKIVPNMESGEQATAVATKSSPGKGDEVVVRVFPLQNVTATQLIPALRPLLPQWSNISSYTPGNTLIILGRASNLDRIASIIYDIDKSVNSRIQVVTLKHASASQVATVLNNLQTSSRASGESNNVSVAVDERTNSILLGGSKANRLKMRVLISQLDSPASAPAGNTEVVYLRYLQAKDFAPLLSKIAQNILGKETGANFDASTSEVPADASSGATKTDLKPKSITINSTVIQAEPSTNAVIITAPPSLMKALKEVIAKLDIRPAQVMVEGIIAEVDESNLTDLGIQWGSVTPSGDVNNSGGATITSFPNFGAGVVGIMPSVQIKTVLSILTNLNGVNILSTPSIMVLDNKKATIEIGQDVPFQTGSYATTGGTNTVTPFNTITQKPVTLRLDVTPQINLGRSVRLNLALKNDTLQNPQNPGLTPIINTSKINNSVIINSDDVLVLGGLISHTNNENVNKVPILGDIPIIGTFFQQKISHRQKKNLMVFIKPIIVHNGDDAMTITHQKYAAIRSIQANYVEDLQDIGNEPLRPALPPWKNKKDLPSPFQAASK